MNELFDLFTYEFGIRALYASVMIGMMCGVLGCFIVLRNMSLIGDALSHAVLPGVVFGFVLAGASAIAIFSGAVAAGLLSAIFITWLQRNANTKNDAAIGIVFTAMFAIGVIAITKVSRRGAHLDLDHFLFGNVLGLNNADLYLTGIITAFVLISVVAMYRYLFATTFQPVIAQTMGISVRAVHYYLMLMLAFAIVVSLQAVGVILVVAMLITPASTALLLTNNLKKMIIIAALVGVFSCVLGLIITDFYNTTPGPAMTLTATLIYLIAVFLAPEKGLVFRHLHKRKVHMKIQIEDTLKQSLKLQQAKNLSFKNLSERLGMKGANLKNILKILSRNGQVIFDRSGLILTEKGVKEATRLVRAHRLWETYLVDQVGLNSNQIHEDAEKYEHLLTEELLDEMDASLGYPKTDPHGSPIPQKWNKPQVSLFDLKSGEEGSITRSQLNEHLIAKLWQYGLLPASEFKILFKDEKEVKIEVEGDHVSIPATLARKISVEKSKALT